MSLLARAGLFSTLSCDGFPVSFKLVSSEVAISVMSVGNCAWELTWRFRALLWRLVLRSLLHLSSFGGEGNLRLGTVGVHRTHRQLR